MSFNSIMFLCWALPIFALAYYVLVPMGKFAPIGSVVKKLMLLGASFLFATWITQEHTLFFVVLILLNWLVGLIISWSRGVQFTAFRQLIAKVALFLIVACNVLCLLIYKYLDFFGLLLGDLFHFSFQQHDLIQPLGISFLTFSLISYVVDCYRKKITADKNPLNFAVWALFFPKLTSGPIARYNDMFSQESVARSGAFDRELVVYGIRRFVIGLAKKVLIADVLGVAVDRIFLQQAYGIDTPTAWVGILAYTLQIFFDFSGYSDMAIGLAAIFGYRLKENFNYPYKATNLGEFWHRWHISLSTWLRDYIYFPLGGSKHGNVYLNLTIVFLISGLWHGANITFIVWGAWYALFMVVERICRLHVPPLVPWLKEGAAIPAKLVGWVCTMFVVIVGWVFFRSADIAQAFDYLQLLIGIGQVTEGVFTVGAYLDGRVSALLIVGALLSLPLGPWFAARFEGRLPFEIARCIAYPALLVLCLSFVVSSNYSPFLYAQF